MIKIKLKMIKIIPDNTIIFKLQHYYSIIMYTVKYRPTNMTDFVGNKPAIQPFIR